MDDAYLCFPHIGTTHLRQSNRALSNSPNEATIQHDGFHPSSEDAKFRAFDRGSLLLLLLVQFA